MRWTGSSSWKDTDIKVSGRMHLFNDHRDDFSRSIDSVPQVMNHVYHNFVSMANVAKHQLTPVRRLISFQDELLQFVRCALKWCVNEHGGVNNRLVALLTRIEAYYFVEVSNLLNGADADQPWGVLLKLKRRIDNHLDTMVQEIVDAYILIQETCKPSIFTFREKSVMVCLDETLQLPFNSMPKKKCILIKKFIGLVIKESTDRTSWEDILPWVEHALDYMSCYYFCVHWAKSLQSPDIINRVNKDIYRIILYVLMCHSDSTPPFTDELLLTYVECFDDALVWLQEEVHYHLTGKAKDQIKMIQDFLSLVCSLVNNMRKHTINQAILSFTKRYIGYALRKLACIILLFYHGDNSYRDNTSYEISNWSTRNFQALLLPLNSDGFLCHETLIRYAYYFQHYWRELQINEGINMTSPSENQPRFDEDLVSMAHVVFYKWPEHHVEHNILLNSREYMCGVLRGLGSIICLSLNNEADVYKRMAPDLLSNMERVKQLTSMFIVKMSMGATRQVQGPQTNLLGFLSFLRENLEELKIHNFDLVKDWKDQLQTIQDHVVVFKSFLQNTRDHSINHDSSHEISVRIRNAAYGAEYIINTFAAGAFHVGCRSFLINDLIKQLTQITEKIRTGEIVSKGSSDVLPQQLVPEDTVYVSSPSRVMPADVVVGFEIEMKQVMVRLASNKKQLDVISIVGMPGIGKTTLATKVYRDPYTVNHFQIRAWCVVSHVYDKKDLLQRILGTDGIPGASYRELGEVLHKKLIGRRYLIVLDDVWDIDAFNCLKPFFPNVYDGSRVVITSRSILMGNDSNTIKLHPLSDGQSWKLLKEKVYPRQDVPVGLLEIGERIAKKCRGLPLAVVVVAGLLAKSDKDQDAWNEISERLSIYNVADDSQGEGMKVLDLSYELLPDHLKPLFLYIGAFPEDMNISVSKLTRLWIAEGFIKKTSKWSLEAEADTYLMDLIDRSLVMIGERKSNGSVKSCRLHDLIRDMCIEKGKTENFMEHITTGEKKEQLAEYLIYQRRVCVSGFGITNKDKFCESSPSHSTVDESPPHPQVTHDDLSRILIPTRLSTLLLFGDNFWGRGVLSDIVGDRSAFENHKMLRVFDTGKVKMQEDWLSNISLPMNLRYFVCNASSIPSSVFSLWNLETLVINSVLSLNMPGEVWKMAKLRHLHIYNGLTFCANAAGEECCTDKLENLLTLSWPIFSGGEDTNLLIRRFPNLVRLRCVFYNISGDNNSGWPQLESLHQLQSLKVRWGGLTCNQPPQFSLPSTLKKLSLGNYFGLKWKNISSFQQVVPKLEILKLGYRSVSGELWDMEDGVFPKLKFLKLVGLDIKQWIASAENFPCLENLVLHNCSYLEEIPCSFGEIYSLEKIELDRCSHSASESAKHIQQQQFEDFGNDLLKVYVSLPYSPPPKAVITDDDEPSEE